MNTEVTKDAIQISIPKEGNTLFVIRSQTNIDQLSDLASNADLQAVGFAIEFNTIDNVVTFVNTDVVISEDFPAGISVFISDDGTEWSAMGTTTTMRSEQAIEALLSTDAPEVRDLLSGGSQESATQYQDSASSSLPEEPASEQIEESAQVRSGLLSNEQQRRRDEKNRERQERREQDRIRRDQQAKERLQRATQSVMNSSMANALKKVTTSIRPNEDGVNAINVSHQAITQLGKALNRDARTPFEFPELGSFESITGLYLYLHTPVEDPSYRTLHGQAARAAEQKRMKERSLQRIIPEWKNILATAMWIKLYDPRNSRLLDLMQSHAEESTFVGFYSAYTETRNPAKEGEEAIIVQRPTFDSDWYPRALDTILKTMRHNARTGNFEAPTFNLR